MFQLFKYIYTGKRTGERHHALFLSRIRLRWRTGKGVEGIYQNGLIKNICTAGRTIEAHNWLISTLNPCLLRSNLCKQKLFCSTKIVYRFSMNAYTYTYSHTLLSLLPRADKISFLSRKDVMSMDMEWVVVYSV